MWHRPRSLQYQVRHCGEGQTPVTLSCVEDDGLGDELRVPFAHSLRNGHHGLPRPAGITSLDPVRSRG